MEVVRLTLDDIIQMTLDVGDDWAVAHAERLLKLIEDIGTGMVYDFSVMELAAYMHDWGAFPTYAQKDVEHALRSRTVVETEILPCLELTSAQSQNMLEAIELHDYRDTRPTNSKEALLLREADMLEFLGMMGLAREFARGPKDVDVCYKRVLSRRADIEGRFTIPRAQEIARLRLERMDQCLHWLEEESFGVL